MKSSRQSCLRILHVEDDADDAEMLAMELERHGIHCQVTRVATRADFESHLQKGETDLILSDSNLPGFDCWQALELARLKCPEIPFIVLSGHHSSEIKYRAITRGAADFVSKDKLQQLPEAIERVRLAAAPARKRPAKLPSPGVMVIARCKTFRCLAFRDAEGKWRDCIRSNELPEVIEWFEL